MEQKVDRRRVRLTEPAHVTRIKAALAARGYASMAQAAKKVGMHEVTLSRIVNDGLSANPAHSTVERLRELGIYDFVLRHSA